MFRVVGKDWIGPKIVPSVSQSNCPMDTNEFPAFSEAPENDPQPRCAGCEQPLFERTGRTPLCSDCRARFIRYPVPNWIKLFGAAVLIMTVYGLTRLPSSLTAAIHHKRGERAMERHQYATAQRELEAAVKMQPDYLEANLHLLIAAYYNEDFAAAYRTSQKLDGREVEDKELYERTSDIMQRIGNTYPSDSIQAFIMSQPGSADEIPEAEWAAYLKNHPREFYSDLARASAASDRKEYPLAEALLYNAMQTDPENTRALHMMVSVKREQLRFDSALYYADRLLDVNKEIAASYGAKARVLLKQKRDKDAQRLAQEGLALDPKDGYCLATLALVHHYRGDTRSRDALIGKSASDTALQAHFSYVSDIISGKTSFRN